MRNLTIRREKSAAASSVPIRIYIEDPDLGDILINGLPCRLLGTLANGEKATFTIEDEEAKLFALSPKQSTDQCHEYLTLPEGESDLFIRGQNHFNPLAGNPFQFQGVTEEEVLEYRKKGQKKGVAALVGIIAAVVVLLGALLAIFLLREPANAKEFTSDGMTITLTEDFEREFLDGFTAACKSPEAAMFAVKEEFTLMEGAEDLTIEEYVDILFQNNPLTAEATLNTEGEIPWFEYTYMDPMEGQTYRYFVAVYKTEDAFWLVQFATPEAMYEEMMPDFHDWAKSVSFS